jgi:ADP-ribose pyrophosphatase
VEHPGAVAILPLDVDNMIWMVSQYRKAVEQVLLEIPAGTLEENEDPLDCAKRELAEETGLKAGEWQEIIQYYCAPGFCDEKTIIYLARNLEPESSLSPDGDEFLELVKIPLKEAYQRVMDGQIVDGKSIIASPIFINIARKRCIQTITCNLGVYSGNNIVTAKLHYCCPRIWPGPLAGINSGFSMPSPVPGKPSLGCLKYSLKIMLLPCYWTIKRCWHAVCE